MQIDWLYFAAAEFIKRLVYWSVRTDTAICQFWQRW